MMDPELEQTTMSLVDIVTAEVQELKEYIQTGQMAYAAATSVDLQHAMARLTDVTSYYTSPAEIENLRKSKWRPRAKEEWIKANPAVLAMAEARQKEKEEAMGGLPEFLKRLFGGE